MGYSRDIHGVFMGYSYVSGMCRVCIGYVSVMCRNIRVARGIYLSTIKNNLDSTMRTMRDNKTAATKRGGCCSGCHGQCCCDMLLRVPWAMLAGHVLAAATNALGVGVVEDIYKRFARARNILGAIRIVRHRTLLNHLLAVLILLNLYGVDIQDRDIHKSD